MFVVFVVFVVFVAPSRDGLPSGEGRRQAVRLVGDVAQSPAAILTPFQLRKPSIAGRSEIDGSLAMEDA